MTIETRSNTGGYEPRFIVERVDGQPIPSDRRYMVLAFDGSDPEAVRALRAYAKFKEEKNPRLALDILGHLANPKDAPKQHRY
ncbi:hypothetical protein [Neorhizobium galegae]|uniref:hypothetical protein n=1 Tax=Neorhizobium galegae TaxID=399 RepID=UPI0006228C65|nr:hypothetical protein [Neorhizobium galegae]CDZ55056.1 Hypothetical protein NGAL_HAMBI2427_59680 [Neorhizobium galegae bv. orientalis]